MYKEKTNSKQNKCKDFADWIFLVVFVESGLSLVASMTGTVKISNHIYDLVDIYSPIPVILGIMTFIWFSEQSGQVITNKVIGGGDTKNCKTYFFDIFASRKSLF